MKITIESSKLVKPAYNNGNEPNTNHHLRLSVFDKITYNIHTAFVYVFNPPILISNNDIELGLSKVLAEYREVAGRLGEDPDGNLVIFLNDQGVRFIEATVDSKLEDVLPSIPTKEIESMYPSLYGVKEMAQVQLTRFTCGSLVLAFTKHHFVADGHSASNFLVAWGLATRCIAIDPIPLRTRDILFKLREPPVIQYDHHKTEFMKNKCTIKTSGNESKGEEEEIVIHKVHLTIDFINKLRAKASAGVLKPYSRFATTLGHLWRVITKARGLDGDETTQIRISVNGRMRMDPKVPNEYFGNLVLWAFPRSKVRDLINQPLSYAVELIHDAVAKVNDSYFKSFIDFANSDIVSKDGLVSTAVMNKRILSPNLEVESWLTFPFYNLDLGNCSPYNLMHQYFDTEGLLYFLPSYLRDGSIDVIVPVLAHNLYNFKNNCYSLD